MMKLLIFAMMFLGGLALTSSCGENCPSGLCLACPCGTTKRMDDIGAWCAKYSWNQACCKCVVSHESAGNGNAMHYNTDGSADVGLWQINKINWDSCNSGKAPCDANANLACAIKVYGWGGNTFKFWSTAQGCGCLSLSRYI